MSAEVHPINTWGLWYQAYWGPDKRKINVPKRNLQIDRPYPVSEVYEMCGLNVWFKCENEIINTDTQDSDYLDLNFES